MATQNGNSNGSNGTNGGSKDTLVFGQTSQGAEIHATLVRITRFSAVFEIYNSAMVLRTSEVLENFKIVISDRTIYSGRAIVRSLVNAGLTLVCEVKLNESSFSVLSLTSPDASMRESFGEFIGQWQSIYKVLPEFKVVLADMQTFLSELRVWLDQIELQIRSSPTGDRGQMERDAVREIGDAMVPAFNNLHERLEELSGTIPEELRPTHQNLSHRQLHPLTLCAPFAYRTYSKPLGYAGDYEMVNMIARDPFEGGSLFAKVVNYWFLCQWPAAAHRNRIKFLKQSLEQETLKAMRAGRPLRVFNLGCGPAREIQQLLADNTICNHVNLTLVDFNEETIQHVTQTLNQIKMQSGAQTPIQLIKRSVHQIIKEGTKPSVGTDGAKYDMVYCAGLFDYLSDRTCRQLMNIFYNWLAPGGLLLATNVNDTKPFRHMLEFVLDWHLIYRNKNSAVGLLPDQATEQDAKFQEDETSVNIFIEVRKPENAK
jgi:extracellular factor (EF) 3-hydroxypalmitic acid methyl ester biosynthesis protein